MELGNESDCKWMFLKLWLNGGIQSTKHFLVAKDLWGSKDLRKSVQVTLAKFGQHSRSSSNYGL